MLTKKEIVAKYKKLHDDLTKAYYGRISRLTKDEFNFQHGQIWSDMEVELIASGFIEAPQLPRDLEAEIDDLNARVISLEAEA